MKTQKLIVAYEKIALRVQNEKWIYKCCRNYPLVEEIYNSLLEMVVNIREFAFFLLDDEDIESKPGCFSWMPSMRGIDFLVTDLDVMLDLFYTGLSSYAIKGHEKLDLMFTLSLTVYKLLQSFKRKYT